MKKICFFAHNNNLTGANKSMINLIEEISKHNPDYLFTVVIPKKGIIEEELKKRNISCKIIRSYNLTYHINGNKYRDKMKVLLKRLLNIVSHYQIKSYILKKKFDIIHVNSLLTYEGAKVAEELLIPYVWHLREFLEEDHHLSMYNTDEVMHLLKKSEACIGISKLVVKKYTKVFNLNNIIQIYNGLPLEECCYERTSRKTDEIHISIIGRISESKGQLLVLKAYINLINRGIKNLGNLYIVGSPGDDKYNEIYEKNLIKIVKEHKLENRVVFVPYTDDVLKYRKLTEITIVSSLYEAFGRVTIEGMLAQQVVIANDSGASPELILDNKTGLLFELNNIEDLEKKIELSITDINIRESLQIEGYKYALNNFSITNTATSIRQVYENILLD